MGILLVAEADRTLIIYPAFENDKIKKSPKSKINTKVLKDHNWDK